MTKCEWIICERTGRWAAAFRMALRRDFPSNCQPRLRELRTLDELTSQLAQQPAVAMVEVRRGNLAAVLTWVAEIRSTHVETCCLALLDNVSFDREDRGEVTSALRSAGAVEICDSPRQLQHVLAIARRHAQLLQRNVTGPAASESFSDWAWSLLPWQSTRRQVG
jgi:hypothetical protein